MVEHSSSKTPPVTSILWGSAAERSHTLPQAPDLASYAPNQILSILAEIAAPIHMGHGSRVTYISQSHKRQKPIFRQALFIASTSACKSAFCLISRLLYPRAIIFPLHTITAPTGTSPIWAAFFASRIASRINFSSMADAPPLYFIHIYNITFEKKAQPPIAGIARI